MRLARRLLLAAWAGVLVTIGAIVAPTLFATVADRHLAGLLAGRLFRVATLLSAALAALLVVLAAAGPGPRLRQAAVAGPALLLAASEWLVRPMLEAARAAGGTGGATFAAWHAVSSGLYWTATAWVAAELVRALRA